MKPVGIIGAGSFGTAVANLIAPNSEVILFTRRAEVATIINTQHTHLGMTLSPRIRATNDLAEVGQQCDIILPIVPSGSFRRMIQELSVHLRPYHILIHGTKGFDVSGVEESAFKTTTFSRRQVRTMSEVIAEESVVVRIGCLSGPHLSKEIMDGQPTAGVVASKFEEVIEAGKRILDSPKFHVYGSYEILGAELAGSLKNIIALGSGMLGGLGMGRNLQAMLITRGLIEMIQFGKAMGTTSRAFLGTAGIGDLIATATSTNSRNYTFGKRIAQGEKREDIIASMNEVAEGLRTIQIARQLARHYKLHVPITKTLYRIIFEELPVQEALSYLITYPYDVDVDFM